MKNEREYKKKGKTKNFRKEEEEIIWTRNELLINGTKVQLIPSKSNFLKKIEIM